MNNCLQVFSLLNLVKIFFQWPLQIKSTNTMMQVICFTHSLQYAKEYKWILLYSTKGWMYSKVVKWILIQICKQIFFIEFLSNLNQLKQKRKQVYIYLTWIYVFLICSMWSKRKMPLSNLSQIYAFVWHQYQACSRRWLKKFH